MSTGFIPRNTFVLVRLQPRHNRRVGQIVVPAQSQHEICEGEVVAVGREASLTTGSESQTYDLAPGQRVLVKHQRRHQTGPRTYTFTPEGIPLELVQDELGPDQADGKLFLFDQFNILAILPPVEDEPLELIAG